MLDLKLLNKINEVKTPTDSRGKNPSPNNLVLSTVVGNSFLF